MMRSLTLVSTVGCSDRRIAPQTPMATSSASAATGAIQGFRPRELPSISTPGLAKIATLRNVMPHSPISEAVCASASGSDNA